MCGRFVAVWQPGWAERLGAELLSGLDTTPRYNIAPTQQIAVVRERFDDGGREARGARWGLVPSWAKDPAVGSRMINARSETVVDKPSFRSAAARRRCLIPATGYYEWQKVGSAKQPFFLRDPGDDLLAFAGLYEKWSPKDDPDAEPLWTATIITTAASDALGVIHDRTPVILPADMWADWLDTATTDKGAVAAMLAAVPEPHLTPTAVGKQVGNVRSQGPGLIEPVET